MLRRVHKIRLNTPARPEHANVAIISSILIQNRSPVPALTQACQQQHMPSAAVLLAVPCLESFQLEHFAADLPHDQEHQWVLPWQSSWSATHHRHVATGTEGV